MLREMQSRDEGQKGRSSTIVLESKRESSCGENNGSSESTSQTLILRPSSADDRKVKWDDSVVDNEHLNKKKSKICCIYHKPRKPGEVDSDSETSSESEDENGPNQYERQPRYIRKKMGHHKHTDFIMDHKHELKKINLMLYPKEDEKNAWDIVLEGTCLPLCIMAKFLMTENGSKDGNENFSMLHIEPSQDYGSTLDRETRSFKDFGMNVFEESHLNDDDLNFRFHRNPCFFLSNGDFVDFMVESNISQYLEFRLVEKTLLYIEKDGTFFNVPCCKEDIFLNENLTLLERRKLMKAMNLALKLTDVKGDSGKIIESYSLEKLSEMRFTDLLKQLQLSPVYESIIAFVMSGFLCWADAEKASAVVGLERMQRYLRSMGKYGKQALLYPIYGASEIIQGLCRATAVMGANHILGTSIADVRKYAENDDLNLVQLDSKVLPSEKKQLLAHKVIQFSESRENPLARVTYVTRKSLASDDTGVLHAVLPPTDAFPYCINLFQLNAETKECPMGYYVIYGFCDSPLVSHKSLLDVTFTIVKDLEVVFKAGFDIPSSIEVKVNGSTVDVKNVPLGTSYSFADDNLNEWKGVVFSLFHQ